MFGIMNAQKRKMSACYGIQKENNRTADNPMNFKASDIDWNKTQDNVFLVQSDNFRASINAELEKHNITKVRKDAVAFIDVFYGASPEFFENKSKDEIIDYFKDCLEYHNKTYGKAFNAVIHFDENTPHMQAVSVPIIEEQVDGKTEYHLNAKKLMGNQKAYSDRQDSFYEEVSKKYGLERGEIKEPGKKKKHLDVLSYKLKKTEEQLELIKSDLDKSNEMLMESQQEVSALKIELHTANKEKEALESEKADIIKQIKDCEEQLANIDVEGEILKHLNAEISQYGDVTKNIKHVEEKTNLFGKTTEEHYEISKSDYKPLENIVKYVNWCLKKYTEKKNELDLLTENAKQDKDHWQNLWRQESYNAGYYKDKAEKLEKELNTIKGIEPQLNKTRNFEERSL